MIYLASPYTHANAAIRQQRFDAVCRVAAELMRRSEIFFSPIAPGAMPTLAVGMFVVSLDQHLRKAATCGF